MGCGGTTLKLIQLKCTKNPVEAFIHLNRIKLEVRRVKLDKTTYFQSKQHTRTMAIPRDYNIPQIIIKTELKLLQNKFKC